MGRFLVPALTAAVALAGFALAGCGGDKSSTPTTTTTATESTTETSTTATTVPVSTMSLLVYLLRDGKVAPARRSVLKTKAVAGAALAALAAGAGAEHSAGLTTALPPRFTFEAPSVDDGVVSVTPPPEGLSRRAEAQIVYTLTQFPTVRAVEIAGRKLRRADFEAETPQILVEGPTPFDMLTSPVRIHGTANTFEATFMVELLLNAAGQRAFKQFVTATSGSGTRGTFDVTIPFTVRGSGPATLVVYEESAENGQPIHRVEIPVFIRG